MNTVSSVLDRSPWLNRSVDAMWDRSRWRALVFLITSAAAGLLAGIVWLASSPRAQYHVDDSLRARLAERDYAEVIASDASYTVLMLACGLMLGLLAWAWFHRRGWVVVPVVLVGSTVLGVVAWQTGEMLGGSGLMERVASASAGDLVQVDLELRSLSALAASPFAAITPVMLLSAFLPEKEEVPQVDAPRRRETAR